RETLSRQLRHGWQAILLSRRTKAREQPYPDWLENSPRVLEACKASKLVWPRHYCLLARLCVAPTGLDVSLVPPGLSPRATPCRPFGTGSYPRDADLYLPRRSDPGPVSSRMSHSGLRSL